MTNSKILDHAKEQYSWEAQRRDKLNSSASIPIGFATIGATVIAPVAAKIKLPFDWVDLTLLVLAGLAIIFGGIFVFHTIKFFLGPIYKYVADCDSVVEFWNESKIYYKKYPESGNFDDKFDDFLLGTFSKCATVNCQNNDDKSRRLYLMNRWVLSLMLPCLLASALVVVLPIFDLENNESQKSMVDKTPTSVPPPPQPPAERGVKDGAKSPMPKTQ